jgi:two-component system sensor histidine kinase ChiS
VPEAGCCRSIVHLTDKIKYPYGNVVLKIFTDRNRDLWFFNDVRIYRYNRETDNFTGYEYDTRLIAERPADNYIDVYEDGQGIFWTATTDGLIRFDPATKEIKRYRNNPNDSNSLSHNVVRTVAPDPFDPNILWLGTKGGGLNRFDKQTETFSVLTEKDGLPNNVIYGILTDEEGNLWMSTNHGISRFNPRTKTFRNFDKNDGLQDNEFNACAFFKSKSGELFFGGINGFNAFYPAEVKDNPNPPPVVLTDFHILNQPVSFKTKDSPLKQTITDTQEITLNYEQRFFSFEFAALDFTEPGKNQYAYQLEGFDKNRVEVGTRRTAFYTNVSPDTYLFRVIASNNDGVWNREGVTIRITILPPSGKDGGLELCWFWEESV